MKTLSEREKNVLCWAAAVLLLITCFILSYLREQIRRPHTAKDYQSSVAQEDCMLCGQKNPYRGADLIVLAVLNRDHFDQYNVGLKQYCSSETNENAGERCPTLLYQDQALSEREQRHKYAPFDINHTYRLHPDWQHRTILFTKMEDRHGTSGVIESYEKNGITYGRLEQDSLTRADPNYLASIVCQDCFEKIYPVTRRGNSFLYDYQTGGVYSLCGEEERFSIREYTVELIYRSPDIVVFFCGITE